MHYHLIGIAGTAMGSLAGLLQSAGHHVTGSDHGVYPPMSDQLEALGIEYSETYDPANLDPAPDVVVVGNAISRGNPELEVVLDRGLYYTSSAAVVREEFLRGRRPLAVAGTHGKTSTASLLAWLLESAGMNPSFLIGGVVENFGSTYRLTDSEWFVVEADEYDTAYFDKGPKMWHYQPYAAIVNNMEFDHADIYRDEIAYRFAFERFVNLIPSSGCLALGVDSEGARDLAAYSHCPVESYAYVADGAVEGTEVRWTAHEVTMGPEGSAFTVVHDGAEWGRVESPLAGAFAIRNSLAAIAIADFVGADRRGVIEGFRTFESVRRRMEVRGEVRGVTVIDDFAHHPTAVRETLAAARQRFGDRRIVAVFEPRSYTAQRKEFEAPYEAALGGADIVVLAGIARPERYDAESALDPAAMVHRWQEEGRQARYIPAVDDIVAYLDETTNGGDVVVIMSNGSFGGIHEKLLERLAE